MRYGYYTGCSITETEQELEVSLRSIFEELSLQFEELETPGCCGSLFEGGGDVAPARELLVSHLIDTCGEMKSLIVPCSNCYRIIQSATGKLAEGLPRIVHPLELLARDVSRDILKSKRVRQIQGLKVSPYYGCVFKSLSDSTEVCNKPRYMEELFELLGIDTVWFPEYSECCGGQQHMDALDAWGPVSKRIIDTAVSWNVDIISVTCTQCHSLLEGSVKSDKIIGEDKIVIMYFSQIVGYIMGLDKRSLFSVNSSYPLG